MIEILIKPILGTQGQKLAGSAFIASDENSASSLSKVLTENYISRFFLVVVVHTYHELGLS